MKGYCMFCHSYTEVYPVKDWNKEIINHYCKKHIDEVKWYNEKEKQAFYEYYKEQAAFEWLPEDSKALWRKIDSEKRKGK